jgi:hypothetical protein
MYRTLQQITNIAAGLQEISKATTARISVKYDMVLGTLARN